jgi:hypothetical protein
VLLSVGVNVIRCVNVSRCVTVRHSGMQILSSTECEEDGQCTYDVTLRGVSSTIVVVGKE